MTKPNLRSYSISPSEFSSSKQSSKSMSTSWSVSFSPAKSNTSVVTPMGSLLFYLTKRANDAILQATSCRSPLYRTILNIRRSLRNNPDPWFPFWVDCRWAKTHRIWFSFLLKSNGIIQTSAYPLCKHLFSLFAPTFPKSPSLDSDLEPSLGLQARSCPRDCHDLCKYQKQTLPLQQKSFLSQQRLQGKSCFTFNFRFFQVCLQKEKDHENSCVSFSICLPCRRWMRDEANETVLLSLVFLYTDVCRV